MVKTKISSASNLVELPPNWHTTDKFTGDEMIDAYFMGKTAGIEAGWDEKFKILANPFSKNIEEAVKISEELYKEVLKSNISLKSIHLKSDGLTKFTSLFISDSDEYVSDNFLKVHEITRKYRAHKKSDDIYMSFLFMPFSDKLSHDCLKADGYFLQYDKNK